MSPEQWINKLKAWQKNHKEQIARALLSPPKRTTIGKILKPTGVTLVMGDRRGGKSVVAYKIAEYFHEKKGLPCCALYPHINRHLRRLLPKWIKLVTDVKDLPHNCICIIDEAALQAHARRGQSKKALDMEELVALSEQKGQMIIMISHHARKLDINDVHGSNIIIWKQPTMADTIWERDELQIYVLRAWEFFQKLYPKRWNPTKPIPRTVLQANFCMNLRRMEFYTFKNGLPTFWSNELSAAFKLLSEDRKEKKTRRAKKGEQAHEQRRGHESGRQGGGRHAKGGRLQQSKGDPDRGRTARHQALSRRTVHPS